MPSTRGAGAHEAQKVSGGFGRFKERHTESEGMADAAQQAVARLEGYQRIVGCIRIGGHVNKLYYRT